MADKAEFARRFGTLTLAAVFLITSIAFTAVIFWQSRNNGNSNTSTVDQNGLESSNSPLTQQPGAENMLQGTQLAEFTPSSDAVSELQKIDLVEGTGEVVQEGARVTAHYTGAYVVNGEIFQSSHDSGQPIPFGLNEVITGWTQGVPGMKVGGKRRLIIPGALAYGEAPEGYTPGSTERPMGPLVFDIEITAVEQ